MGRTAAKKKPPATPAQDEIEQYMEAINTKKVFVGTTAGMGWRLALTVLVPIIVGVKLDDHFNTAPSYTLASLVLAVAGSVLVVRNTVRDVNKAQAEEDKKKEKDS